MDNTELHYLTYDSDAIWNEMITNYVEAGGDLLYPGDEKEMLLRSVQADIMQVFAGVDNALRMATLRYAVGDYLDIIGDLRNCTRIEATAATATVTITTNATGEEQTLEAGTSMTADGEMFYLLTEDLALSGYQEILTAEVIADRTGSSGNGLLSGTQLQLATANEAVYSIYAASDASGGNEREEDDVYRERIRLHGMNSVTTGPAAQYEAAAEAVSSVIQDAKAIRSPDLFANQGKVNIYLALSTNTGSAAIIDAVLEELTRSDVRPLTDYVAVYLAPECGYVLNIGYYAENTASIRSAMEDAAEEYQAWQDSEIGRAFNPDRLVAAMYQAGATRVTILDTSVFDGGEVKYTAISATERCKGTVTLTELSE